jgi:hypothetical protein
MRITHELTLPNEARIYFVSVKSCVRLAQYYEQYKDFESEQSTLPSPDGFVGWLMTNSNAHYVGRDRISMSVTDRFTYPIDDSEQESER